MKNFIWNRDPQEAMDNPYEYEAQEQFRNEAENLLKDLRKELINSFSYSLNDNSFDKAIFMLTVSALDSATLIVHSLNSQSHRITAHLLRTIDESLDLAAFFNSRSEKSEKQLQKWYNDEIISHSEYRTYIKDKYGQEEFENEKQRYRTISKFSHNTYKTLLYSYIQRSDSTIVHESLYDSGILIPIQTISMYHAISGIYFEKIAFKMVEFKLIKVDKLLKIMKDSQEEHTIERKYKLRKRSDL